MPDNQILFVGGHHHRFLVDVFAAVTQDLFAHLTDVLEGGRRTRRVKDKNVGGCLAEATKRRRSRFALSAVQIPFLQRIFRECVDGRKIGNVDFDDAVVVGHQTCCVAVRMYRRSHRLAELIVHKLLLKKEICWKN